MMTQRRIDELEAMLRNSVVIDDAQTRAGVVGLGSRVTVDFDGDEETYTIVGAIEAKPTAGMISNESPIGQALIGKRAGQTAQVVVVCVEIFSWLASGPVDLCLLQLRPYCPDDARSHLILQVEDVLQCTIEAVCPQMHPAGAVDKLPADPYPAPCLANASFQDIAHPHLAPHLLNIHSPALVGKTRVAGDNEKPADPR